MATNTTKRTNTTQRSTTKPKQAKPKENKPIKWNNVHGIMDLYAREVNLRTKSFMSFSTSIGKKNENDEYDNIYFDVLFKKNEAPVVDEGRLQIKIFSGFLTLSVYKDGSVHPVVMVMDYVPIYDDDDESDIPF